MLHGAVKAEVAWLGQSRRPEAARGAGPREYKWEQAPNPYLGVHQAAEEAPSAAGEADGVTYQPFQAPWSDHDG